MIAVIRIKGQVKVRRDFEDTLNRLRLKKKYSCIVIENPKKEELGMIEKVRDFVAFGEIDSETYKKLIEARGKFSKSKTHFRLHPPRKGIESKKHFGVGKGVLGNNGKEINKLIMRML
ncbi:hypothetical protein A3K82_03390 [Candidatus Pacearchaeota archaeon RBG_19FT_COMBO_34_9]|nr:MAG: hypothetical protein A3K82_03390 [Candidatus Pacearchaeota archaeon RBG_19FT_COMBO_34_9]OGJ16191.1 MAG: hypothetical protein A3K74_03125 [Candidatus Pacearchaeota archaeon RBG_13_33_26]